MAEAILIGVGGKAVSLSAIVWYRHTPATDAVGDKPAKPSKLRILTFARTLTERSDTKSTFVVNESITYYGVEADQMLALLLKHTEQPA